MKPGLIILNGLYAVCSLETNAHVPAWLAKSDFHSLTRTGDELSMVCRQDIIEFEKGMSIDKGWRILKIKGPLDLSQTGIISSIAGILSQSHIPVFVVSAYQTDYVLIKENHLKSARDALNKNDYKIDPVK